MSQKLNGNRLFGAAAVVLAGGLAAGMALAQEAAGGGRLGHGVRKALATLDLSDAQKAKVQAIFQSHKDEAQAFRSQMQADRAALKTAAAVPNPDPAAVGNAFLKVQANRQAATTRMKAVRSEIDAVLTPEQKAKLDGWVSAHEQQREMFRSRVQN
jgi:Spy/CpxP family protein refolding chaperone